MIAGIQSITNSVIGIHTTYLDPESRGKANVPKSKKIQKFTSSQTIPGGVVRLGKYQSGKPLVLCEGIETGLAVQQATGYAVWACLSASGLQAVQLPESCRHVIVATDHDRGEAGLKAATKVADRYRPQGLTVTIVCPEGPIPDDAKSVDWLDILNRDGEDAIRRAFNGTTVRTPETPERAPSCPRFPVEALQQVIREYAEANAECLPAPVELIAIPALAAVSACIGTTRTIRLKKGWEEPAALFLASVAESGELKSPA